MWEIQYTQKAVKTIRKLNPSIRERIRKGIEKLILNPDLGKQLTGPLKGLQSLKIEKFRVIYKKETDELIVLVIAIGHRKNVYN